MKQAWADYLTDFGLPDSAFDLIRAEDKAQIKKWGEQTHSPAEWMMFLGEEYGELAQAISEWWFREGKLEDVEKEAVQTATLALKIAEMCRVLRESDALERIAAARLAHKPG